MASKEDTVTSLVDSLEVQLLNRIQPFPGVDEKWPDFKFQMLSLANRLRPLCASAMMQAEETAEPLNMNLLTDVAQDVRRQVQFWLAMVTCDTALGEVRDVDDGSGLEAWRQLCKRHQTKTARQRLGTLKTIMDYQFGNLEGFEQRCQEFEKIVKQYETQTGTSVSEDSRMAILIGSAPLEVRKQLQLTAQSYSNYSQMKAAVIEFARNAKEWAAQQKPPDATSRVPAEVAAVNYKGKPRGKHWKGDDGGKGTKGPSYACPTCGTRAQQQQQPSWGGYSSSSKAEPQNPLNKGGARSSVKCFLCGGFGHKSRYCANNHWQNGSDDAANDLMECGAMEYLESMFLDEPSTAPAESSGAEEISPATSSGAK